MDIKQIELEIKELQTDMKLSYRRTVDDAIKIGELLKDAKLQLAHGEFMPWCDRQGINGKQCQRYTQLVEYRAKIDKLSNLSEAYRLIESEENKRKRLEFEKQTERIQIYKKTGLRPGDWDKATDEYRLKKEKEDAEYEERKRKAFEDKKNKLEAEKQKKQQEQTIDTETEQILNHLGKMSEANKEKEKLLSKMRLTGDNASEPIYDALLEYLMALNEQQRLEACHNIIKFCKGIATECQKNSIQ